MVILFDYPDTLRINFKLSTHSANQIFAYLWPVNKIMYSGNGLCNCPW